MRICLATWTSRFLISFLAKTPHHICFHLLTLRPPSHVCSHLLIPLHKSTQRDDNKCLCLLPFHSSTLLRKYLRHFELSVPFHFVHRFTNIQSTWLRPLNTTPLYRVSSPLLTTLLRSCSYHWFWLILFLLRKLHHSSRNLTRKGLVFARLFKQLENWSWELLRSSQPVTNMVKCSWLRCISHARHPKRRFVLSFCFCFYLLSYGYVQPIYSIIQIFILLFFIIILVC